jgi:uncharacterized protein
MANSYPKTIQGVLSEAKTRLLAIYPKRLRELILFGSYARGDYADGSDIDLLLLLDGVSNPMEERERCFPIVCELSLKHNLVLSILPMDFGAFHVRKTPLILNVRREGLRI